MKLYTKPSEFAKRTVNSFAILPTELNSGDVVWLEKYTKGEIYLGGKWKLDKYYLKDKQARERYDVAFGK